MGLAMQVMYRNLEDPPLFIEQQPQLFSTSENRGYSVQFHCLLMSLIGVVQLGVIVPG
jgi:hypothetical protein